MTSKLKVHMVFRFGLMMCICASISCSSINPPNRSNVSTTVSGDTLSTKIDLPEGFEIRYYAKNVENARSLSRSPGGTLFVGTRSAGYVYALRDEDGDHNAEKKFVLDKDLEMPNGVAFKDGDLYVATVNQILRYKNIENRLSNPPEPEIIYDGYPTDRSHGWKYIAFGPDGKLYVPVGAPCNICESKDAVYASITTFDIETKKREIFANGVRNTVGFAWHPSSKDLWFTENGRDWLGDELPACELNFAPSPGLHFGYPYCHQGDLSDPKFGSKRSCEEFEPPVQNLGPHVAPLGMEFYTGDMFPDRYKNQIILAEHGSWNRSKKIGYRLMMVELDGNKSVSYEPFASGWLKDEDVFGRPVDLEHLPDGSILVSDDFADAIYRISYAKQF